MTPDDWKKLAIKYVEAENAETGWHSAEVAWTEADVRKAFLAGAKAAFVLAPAEIFYHDSCVESRAALESLT